MNDITELRRHTIDIATRIDALIDSLRGNNTLPAVHACVDLGHISRDLKRAAKFLARTERELERL